MSLKHVRESANICKSLHFLAIMAAPSSETFDPFTKHFSRPGDDVAIRLAPQSLMLVSAAESFDKCAQYVAIFSAASSPTFLQFVRVRMRQTPPFVKAHSSTVFDAVSLGNVTSTFSESACDEGIEEDKHSGTTN